MVKNVEVVELEDSGVHDLINKTAKELHEKYNKQRKINEKFLKKKTPLKKALSIFFDSVCVILLIFGFIICFSIINTTMNGYMPNFFGYSNLVVASKSMVASGYNVGDIVVIHSVDTDTLNVDDKIAFYLYWSSSDQFDESSARLINEESKTEYSLSFKQVFGFQTKEFDMAEKAKCDKIFHHIRAIYEDENGDYKECKNTKPLVEAIDIPCPNCGGKIQVRKTKKRKNYYICENNPKSCDYISWNKPQKEEKK